jgi:hypothetical protein
MKRVKHVASMGKMRNAYTVFVGKIEGNKPLRKPKLIREDSIKNCLMETMGV